LVFPVFEEVDPSHHDRHRPEVGLLPQSPLIRFAQRVKFLKKRR
jgi:hypothetical protein